MKVLLLGATGLLGHNVLLRLVDEGHQVRVLVRCADGLRVEGDGWEAVVGNPTDRETLCRATEGCEAIINCAGATDMSLHRKEFDAVNLHLPQMVVYVMEQQGIKRLVHVSTVNTVGNGFPGHPSKGDEPPVPPFSENLYAASKLAGERVVHDTAHEHPDWHVVVVNPGFMLGPYAVTPSSGRMLLAAYRKRVMLAPKGGKAFVHVGDVAQAVVAALTRGESGRRYVAVNSQACLTIKELYLLQAKVCGYRQQVLTIPNWVVLAAGKVGDILRSLGMNTEMSSRNVRLLTVCEHYDSALALRDLGMPQTPIAEAISAFHEWTNKNTTT